MNTVTPLDFASSRNCDEHSRTCETEPADESSSDKYVVWMESTISRSGFDSRTWLKITSRFVSVTNSNSFGRSFVPLNKREARILICRSDSSPETYSTRCTFAISIAICSMSVDLPMPGSPPTSTMEPGTMPPPSTRANSPMGRGTRSSASPLTSEMGRGSERPLNPRTFPVFLETGSSWMTSSTMLSNAPHCGHLPM